MTTSSHVRVTGHMRRSANGKLHTVGTHARRLTLAELIRETGTGGGVGIALSACGMAAVSLLAWAFSAVMSLPAAILAAITLTALGVLGMLLRGDRKRTRRSWLPRALRGALSPRRRLKLWWHRHWPTRRLRRWWRRMRKKVTIWRRVRTARPKSSRK